MNTSHPCSNLPDLPAPRHGLIVLEGMPGAGKTTAACALAQRGLPVLGEYTDDGDGTLLLPGLYVIFDLDPATSLTRRAGRLRPGHPWNHPVALRRLRHFYADPGRALRPVHPGLARALRQPGRVDISGLSDPAQIIRRLSALGVRP